MSQDPSKKVYEKDGGREYVIAADGQQTVESGGKILVQSGATQETVAGATVTEGADVAQNGKRTVGAAGELAFTAGAIVSGQFIFG